MNLLPEMQHVEVIVLSGIIAVTVLTVVSVVVSTVVYLATRERVPNLRPVAAVTRAPSETRVEASTSARSPLPAAG